MVTRDGREVDGVTLSNHFHQTAIPLSQFDFPMIERSRLRLFRYPISLILYQRAKFLEGSPLRLC
jgi:hypothetical protein